jgi:methanogenic corrinoid protein MtbC1
LTPFCIGKECNNIDKTGLKQHIHRMATDYSIGKAAQLAGLTTFLIRAWENRYAVVEPERNDGGQRRYNDIDVERLRSLSRLVQNGHRIGDVASLDDSLLAALLAEEEAPIRSDYVDMAYGAMEAFDAPGLQSILQSAAVELGPVALSDRVIFPFMEEVGRSWHESKVRVMHEHLASTVVHSLMTRLLADISPAADAPWAVVATPPGQQHNIGAACCAVAAADAGWRVKYMGTHIPAEEMLAAVDNSAAAILMLSIVFPAKASAVKKALELLEKDLSPGVSLIVGGSSAGTFLSGSTGRAEKSPRSVTALRELLAARV